MSGFPILDLVLGLIFIYFMLSIICSTAVEIVQSLGKYRARHLEEWLRKVFDQPAMDADGNFYDHAGNTFSHDRFGNLVDKIGRLHNGSKMVILAEAIMDHSSTTGLSLKRKSSTYIDARNFVTALLDNISLDPPGTQPKDPVTNPHNVPATVDDYIAKLNNTKVLSAELKRTFISYAYAVKDNTPVGTQPIELFRKKIEEWYDSSNERLTGRFKRTFALPWTIVFAIVITLAGNIDSVAISKYLYVNKDVSKKLADDAAGSLAKSEKMLNNVTDTVDVKLLSKQVENLNQVLSLGFPIGWKSNSSDDVTIKSLKPHFIGWLATIFAIMMGAPFWFDMLNKVANLRGNGTKPASSSAPVPDPVKSTPK